jgi:hypothetical protein
LQQKFGASACAPPFLPLPELLLPLLLLLVVLLGRVK